METEAIIWIYLAVKNLGKCHILGFDFSAMRGILDHRDRTLEPQDGIFGF